jgi:hypothetical protein
MESDDRELLERIQKGDGESFGVLFDRTHRWLLRRCVPDSAHEGSKMVKKNVLPTLILLLRARKKGGPREAALPE